MYNLLTDNYVQYTLTPGPVTQSAVTGSDLSATVTKLSGSDSTKITDPVENLGYKGQ
jgi:hypothetical protein